MTSVELDFKIRVILSVIESGKSLNRKLSLLTDLLLHFANKDLAMSEQEKDFLADMTEVVREWIVDNESGIMTKEEAIKRVGKLREARQDYFSFKK